jgi:hypothetical protein
VQLGLPLLLASALVSLATHDISPRLERQLVLELKCRIGGAEIIESNPCRICHNLTQPSYQHLLTTTRQAAVSNLCWFQASPTMLNGGQDVRSFWRCALPCRMGSKPTWKTSWSRAPFSSCSLYATVHRILERACHGPQLGPASSHSSLQNLFVNTRLRSLTICSRTMLSKKA